MQFVDLLLAHRGYIPRAKILCFDPGETTGAALFAEGRLMWKDQIRTKELPNCLQDIKGLLKTFEPHLIVYEDYRVYSWKAKTHSWASLHTPKLIGGIDTLSFLSLTPTIKRMAVEAKTFCTDDKLKQWGMYQTSLRHANDAIRHGCYTLLFSKHPVLEKDFNPTT